MERAGVSYKQHPPADAWDAIVIGSGIGGLAAAVLLARHAGQRVLVLERHYTAGGFTHVFQRRDYEWDVGLHYVGEVGRPGPVRALWDDVTGGRIRWAAMPDVYDRIHLGDRVYDLVAGRRRFVETLAARFPAEARGIDDYTRSLRRFAAASAGFFAERALPAALARVAGPWLRRPMRRHSERTALDVLRDFTRDPELVGVLAGQCGDYGLPPGQASFAIHAMVAGHYLAGGYYPVGGSSEIAAGAAAALRAAGGELLTRAEVAAIVVERGRAAGVRMADGRVLRARRVISDAGVPNTFLRLLPPDVAARTGVPEAIAPLAPSAAHLCLYLGLRHTDAELGLTGTNLWLYRDADHDGNFARFLADPASPLPVVYVSFPSAKDPSWARRHPGRSTVEVITLADAAWFAPWRESRWRRRGEDYEALKARFTERMLERVFEVVPALKGRLDHVELSTPLSTRHFANYAHGEMYGLTHTPARFRLPLRAQTSVPGLYLTGQDLVSAGVTGALLGGALAAVAVMRAEAGAVARTWWRSVRG